MTTDRSSGSLNIAESVERAAWIDVFAAARKHAAPALGVTSAELGDATVMGMTGAEHLMLNRAIGARPEREHLAAIADWFSERGIERYTIHLPSEARSPELEEMAGELGLERYRRSWVKLMRGPGEPPEPRPTELVLRRATRDDADRAASIWCDGFDMPAGFAPAIAALARRDGWEMFVAADEEDRPVAAGLLYVDGGVGYLAGGATAPGHREMGAQGALVTVRTRRALELGCRWITSETGEAAPGDPQHSYRNMRRAGLEVIGVRDNWVPAGSVWNHGRRSDESAA